jgi:ribonuclease J
MVSLTFYGGINKIGGNKILLEDDDVRIFLDFGMNFEEHQNYFTEYMPPRKCNCIKDFIYLGLLPDLKGIYRRDYCRHMNLDYLEENSVDGVLISHAHIDHVGYVHFMRKDIPVYVSAETKAVMELFSKIGASNFEEFTGFKPSFQLIKKKMGDGEKRRDARDGIEERNVNLFEFGKKFKIGDLEILPCRVDHSLPGATGYIIYTSDGVVVYTGDLRFHGRNNDWSHNFVDKASQETPLVMLSEGTRIDEREAKTEEYVLKESTKHLSGKKGLAIVNFPIRDTERLLTFYYTAVNNNRKLVLEYRQAMLLDLMRKNGVEGLPKSNDKNIRIFYPKKSWGLIGRNDFPEEQISQDYSSWERDYLSLDNIIIADEISKKQKDYVMFMNYFQLNNLIDIKPIKDSIHIRSICEPFSEEMELDQKRIDNWLKRFGLYPELKIHSSGHACGPAIFKMIQKVNPKKLFPIHTVKPKFFKKLTRINIVYPEYGKKISI